MTRLVCNGLLISCLFASAFADDVIYTCGNHDPHHSTNSFAEAQRFTREYGCRNWSVSSPLVAANFRGQLDKLNVEAQAIAALREVERCFDPRLEVTTSKDAGDHYKIDLRGVRCVDVKSPGNPEQFAFVYAWQPQARRYVLLPIGQEPIQPKSDQP